MTLKVVRVSGDVSQGQKPQAQGAGTAQPVNQDKSIVSQALRSVSNVATAAVVQGEAVMATVRTSAKAAAAGHHRISEYPEARQISEKLADRIRRDDEAEGAHHEFSRVSAKEHLLT